MRDYLGRAGFGQAGAALILFSALVVFPGIPSAAEVGNTEVISEVTLKAEYDDNVNLSSGIGDTPTGEKNEVKSDFILRISPTLGINLPYLDHKISFSFNGDYRKGADSGLSEVNAVANLGFDFRFPGGIGLNLYDIYAKTSFDQALYEETGTADTESNTIGGGVGFKPFERLSISMKYSHRDENSSADRTITDTRTVREKTKNNKIRKTTEEYEKIEQQSFDRDVDNSEARIDVPVWDSISIYGAYASELQETANLPDKDFKQERSYGGLRYQALSGFAVFGEAGSGKIDYDIGVHQDSENTIWKTGLDIPFTQITMMKAAYGENVYGKHELTGSLAHNRPDGTAVTLNYAKLTRLSYYTSGSATIDSEVTALNYKTVFIERFTLGLGGSYNTMKSDTADDKISIGKFSLDYQFHKWLKLGTYYQYAQKKALESVQEYTDNRGGVYTTLVF